MEQELFGLLRKFVRDDKEHEDLRQALRICVAPGWNEIVSSKTSTAGVLDAYRILTLTAGSGSGTEIPLAAQPVPWPDCDTLSELMLDAHYERLTRGLRDADIDAMRRLCGMMAGYGTAAFRDLAHHAERLQRIPELTGADVERELDEEFGFNLKVCPFASPANVNKLHDWFAKRAKDERGTSEQARLAALAIEPEEPEGVLLLPEDIGLTLATNYETHLFLTVLAAARGSRLTWRRLARHLPMWQRGAWIFGGTDYGRIISIAVK